MRRMSQCQWSQFQLAPRRSLRQRPALWTKPSSSYRPVVEKRNDPWQCVAECVRNCAGPYRRANLGREATRVS